MPCFNFYIDTVIVLPLCFRQLIYDIHELKNMNKHIVILIARRTDRSAVVVDRGIVLVIVASLNSTECILSASGMYSI